MRHFSRGHWLLPNTWFYPVRDSLFFFILRSFTSSIFTNIPLFLQTRSLTTSRYFYILLYYLYKAEFFQKLLQIKKKMSWPSTIYRYIDDALSINIRNFHNYVHSYIYRSAWNKGHHNMGQICLLYFTHDTLTAALGPLHYIWQAWWLY